MFHHTRKRMQEMTEAEAAGQSFWTESFDSRARTRIVHRWNRLVETIGVDRLSVFHQARAMLVEQEGDEYLVAAGWGPNGDFDEAFQTGPDVLYPSVIEALLLSLKQWDEAHAVGPFGGSVPRPGAVRSQLIESDQA